MNILLASVLAAMTFTPSYLLLPADTVLYRSTANGYEPLCTLPATHYVLTLSPDSDGYTAVNWLDVNGFVLTSAVEPVDYTPLTPYASRSLTADNDRNPVHIRSAPDHTADNVVGSLPHGAKATVYGYTTGSALIPQVGDVWYYVRYSSGEKATFGYVYCSQVSVDPVTPNSGERVTPAPQEPIETAGEMPPAARIVLIVALCIPAVLIVFLIFRPAPKTKTPRGLDN